MVTRPVGVKTSEVGIENQMILVAKRLDVVLHHQAAADRLDVDRHALAVRGCGEAGGDMGGRAALVFLLGQSEAPIRDVDLLDRCVDDGGEAEVDDLVVTHCLSPSWTGVETAGMGGGAATAPPRLQIDLRSGLKAARRSAVRSIGCSQAAKWPPLAGRL